MRLFIIILAILILPIASAATIHGNIYDFSLNDLNNVILEVDSDPIQKLISKDGAYQFNLDSGDYELVAKYYEENSLLYETKETLKINGGGEYKLDLILLPPLEEDEDLALDFPEYEEPKGLFWFALIIVIIICILVVVYIFKLRKKPLIQEEDDELTQLEKLLKTNKRLTQKEIRKQIPLSEAKISLMITELEHKGKVEKIKKGRSNVIVWKKS